MTAVIGDSRLHPYVAGLLTHSSGRWAPQLFVPASDGAEPMALLLADVSGFTALTRELAAEGATGAEQVGAALDHVFGGILEIVEAFHGLPVASAGDSILAAWPAALCAGIDEASSAADGCASDILERFREGYCVRGVPLSVHIGRADGWAEAVHLGQRDRHLVLIGPAVTAVGRAASRAGPATVVSADTMDARTLLDAGAEPCAGVRDLGQLPSYVPGAVAQRVISGHGDWLADLRRVSLVFVGLPGLETAPAARWHHIVSRLDGVASNFEGELHHLMVDDKGASGILAFGLPPAAHEDDSRRAVLAAQRLARELGTLGVEASMGVATGPVFSGPVGSTSWRRYTVIGDSVNLAARLMALSQGVLCDESTVRTTSALSFESVGSVELKGFSHPVPVFRPTSTRTASSGDPSGRMVGRSPERKVLDALLDQANLGNGGVVVVEAEAGLGKSRLVAHLAERACRAGGEPVIVEADAVAARLPFHVWSELVEEPGTDSADGERRDVVAAQIAQRIAATSRPRLLIAEDTHWFDSGSWSVLVALRAALPDVLLVLTTRPVPHLQADEARLRSDETASVLRVGPLESGDVQTMLAEVLGASSIQPLLLERLVRRSEGNPYFLKEVARALVETGSVVVRDGVARLAPGAEAVLERTGADRLDSVVVARLDRLAPAVQLTAKVASVIGRAFQFQALRAVYPVDGDRQLLPRCLENLERAYLTEQQPIPDSYAFCHAITRDAAYSLLSAAQRRQLHSDVADWLERTNEGDPTLMAAVLAYHRDRAGQAAAARVHYEVAGNHALAVCAYREASAAYERILELVDDPAAREREQLRLAGRLGFAYLGHGDMPRAYEAFGAALAHGGYRMSASAPVLLGHLIKEIVVHIRHERTQTLASSTERDPRVAMGAMHGLCSSYASVSVLGPAPYVLFRTANVAAASAHPVDLAEAYSCLAIAAATTRPDLALEVAQIWLWHPGARVLPVA